MPARKTSADVTVDVQLAVAARGLPPPATIADWVCLAVDNAGVAVPASPELTVRVVASDEIRELNARFRQQDKATNVLAFPAGGHEGLPADQAALLGDVVVCADVVAAEAGEQDKKLEDHWAHMLVHGTLHLLGFDHVTAAEATVMEDLERSILASRGIGDPYAGPGS